MNDPISDSIKNTFNRAPKVIVAENYTHAIHARRELRIPWFLAKDVLYVTTNTNEGMHRLRGLRLIRSQVYIYETAPLGKYYDEVMHYLEYCYVS